MAPRRVVRIELTTTPRFNAKSKAFTSRERAAFDAWFHEARLQGWIRKSSARHSSALLFVPKADGSLRCCGDYRDLNSITKSRIYAPRTGRLLHDDIASKTWRSKIDLENAFHHILIHPDDRWKTTFRTPHGLYEWIVLPFGLKNAPGEFQLYMEDILSDLLGEGVAVHIDDIIVYAHTRQECVRKERQVRDLLRKNDLRVNERKSVPPTTRIKYCGFIYDGHSCKPEDRSSSLRDWPTPKNPTALRAFLGLTNQMRDHVTNYATIASPLYSSTGKSWGWTPRQHSAFLELRDACCSVIATRPHNPHKSARLTTDASLFGIGAILTQEGHTTGIWSRALTSAEKNYPTNERELLAVVEALDHWVHVLDSAPRIEVATDSETNAKNVKANSTNRRINRWISRLQAYPLEWIHIPGSNNPADIPSRRADYRFIRSTDTDLRPEEPQGN